MTDPFACSASVRLRPGREISVRRGHPWVYRGALAGRLPADAGPVLVRAADGEPLGTALPAAGGGSLALRMVAQAARSWNAAALVDRLEDAVDLRRRLGLASDAVRLVHTEGDGLPGLVVDRYGATAVVETYEPYWDALLPVLAEFLVDRAGCERVLARQGRDRGAAARTVVGGLPAEPVVVGEHDWRLPADLVQGQKTGLFLDQRENRRRLFRLAGGAEVLNLFSYSGAFAVAALAGGARRAVNLDASAPALALARRAYEINGFPVADNDFLAGDAFAAVRELAAAAARFDAVVVDPPAFARRRAELAGAWRGHRDLHLFAMRLLRPGGLLLACSCSALLDRRAFGATLQAAAADAGRTVRVLEVAGADRDHPVALACPEMEHLQAWFCRVA